MKTAPSLAEQRRSLGCAITPAEAQPEGAGSASGVQVVGRELVPFGLSLSAKCVVLYPAFLAKLTLLFLFGPVQAISCVHPTLERPGEQKRHERREWRGEEELTGRPAGVQCHVGQDAAPPRSQVPRTQAASGDALCQGSSCCVHCVEARTEHHRNRLDPSGQLNYPLVEIETRV